MHFFATALLVVSLVGSSAEARADTAGSNDERAPSPSRQAELIHLLAHDCGACHGMRRNGGLGPPLRPSDLSAKPESVLVSAVLSGRAGTAMPPWRGLLTETEARWLVRYLRGAPL